MTARPVALSPRESDPVIAASILAAAMALVLALPPALFGWLSWRRFDGFRFTWYVPHEELAQALRTLDPAGIFHAPLFVANMTSGLPIANMFTLTVGQLALSLVLGAAIGANLLAALRPGQRVGVALGILVSLTATAAASSTGLVGCHPGLAGGLITLVGINSSTAATLATWSPLAQAALAIFLFFTAARLRRYQSATPPRRTVQIGIFTNQGRNV
jgi:hypothetical protein